MTELKTYRKISPDAPNHSAGDGEYSNPIFHKLMRAAFKTRRGKYSPHEVAVVDTMVFFHLQRIDLNRCKQLREHYDNAARLAGASIGAHQGNTLADDDKPSMTSTMEIVASTGLKVSARCARVRGGVVACVIASVCTFSSCLLVLPASLVSGEMLVSVMFLYQALLRRCSSALGAPYNVALRLSLCRAL